MSAVGCAILAAGRSSRLGRPKQLVMHRGQPLLRHVAQQACASRCERIAVVLGAHADEVAPTLSGLPVKLLHSAWQEGMAASVREAVSWARDLRLDALLLTLCDQPRLDAAHLDALLAAHEAGDSMVGSLYGGLLSVPALFSRSSFELLEALRGERGAASILRHDPAARSLPWPAGDLDIDTEDDVTRLLSEP